MIVSSARLLLLSSLIFGVEKPMGHLRTFDDTVVDDKEEDDDDDDDDDDEDDWTFGKFATKYSNIRFFKLAFSSDLYFNSLSLASVMATNSDSAASGAEKFSNGSKYVFTVNNENPFVFSFDIVSYSTRVKHFTPNLANIFRHTLRRVHISRVHRVDVAERIGRTFLH